MAAANIDVCSVTVLATASLTQYRAVNAAGAVPAAAATAIGFAKTAAAIGERVAVQSLGVAICEAGAAVAVGAALETDSSGRVVTRSAGVTVGRALTAAGASGDKIEVLLIPN